MKLKERLRQRLRAWRAWLEEPWLEELLDEKPAPPESEGPAPPASRRVSSSFSSWSASEVGHDRQ